MAITRQPPVQQPARAIGLVLVAGLLGGVAGVVCVVVIVALRSQPDPDTARSRAVRLIAGSVAVSGLIGALCGSVVGLVIGLSSYPPTAVFGVVLYLTTIAAVPAAVLGLIVGSVLAAIGHHSDGRE